jgi:hypothetical protein
MKEPLLLQNYKSRSRCQVCYGRNRGKPGDGQYIGVAPGETVLMCDYCHADYREMTNLSDKYIRILTGPPLYDKPGGKIIGFIDTECIEINTSWYERLGLKIELPEVRVFTETSLPNF